MRRLARKLAALLPQDDRQKSMWKNFLQSICLLGIAMFAALYSTSTAREGQIVEPVAASLIALGIALWVGVRFVPRLARDVDWRWLPLFSNYTITRDGFLFLGGLIIVLAAAINTANNLLYMVLSALLAVLTLSTVLSALNFRFL